MEVKAGPKPSQMEEKWKVIRKNGWNNTTYVKRDLEGNANVKLKIDELVKSLTLHLTVIPAKAGIQYFQAVAIYEIASLCSQ